MAAVVAAAAEGSGCRVRTTTRGLSPQVRCRYSAVRCWRRCRTLATSAVICVAGLFRPYRDKPSERSSAAVQYCCVRYSDLAAQQPFGLLEGLRANSDQAGISCFLSFLSVVPRQRLVSPRSTRTTTRAVESSRPRRLSTVICHSSRNYLAESFLSARIRSYVRTVLSPQARPSTETASAGQRIVHYREVSLRCPATCSSLAAAAVGLAARSMLFQSAS